MNSFIRLIAVCAIFVTSLQAQEEQQTVKKITFGKGKTFAALNLGFSSLGFGFGTNVEYAFTDKMGTQLNLDINSYTNNSVKWSIIPLDLWLSYHVPPSYKIGDEAYIIGGPTLVIISAENEPDIGAIAISENKTGFGFGAGYGSKYFIDENMAIIGEFRARFSSLRTQSYQASLVWLSLFVGYQYNF